MITPLAYDVMPTAPAPADPAEAARWEWVSRAHRLLYGRWASDLEERTAKVIGHVRRDAWGQIDLSANLYRQVWDACATLYDSAPGVEHDDEAGSELARLVSDSGYWSRMQRIQRDTLGLREMLVRVDALEGDDELTYRSVTPGTVQVRCHPDYPCEPVEIWEARLRQHASTGRWEWTWDHLDLDSLVYEVVGDRGEDLSAEFLGRRFAGDAYPYRRSDGRPLLPYVVYHAADTGQMWDSWSVLELVEGTYNVGVYYSLFGHVLRAAAWRQRWGIDVVPQGAANQGGGDAGYSAVITDPATVALFRRANEDATPQLGQFDSPVDPREMIEAIRLYEQRLVSFAGINAADQMRMSGDPRSGYAVAVSRDSQRQVQRRYEPVFRRADLELLEVSAALANRAGLGSYPEDGYRIEYRGIPLSAEERDSLRRHVLEQLDKGLLTTVEAYRELHPGASEADALASLPAQDVAASSPFAQVGLPALVQGGIISAAAARRMLGVGEDAAPTAEELAALRSSPNAGGGP